MARVNWANPLARGLRRCWTFSDGLAYDSCLPPEHGRLGTGLLAGSNDGKVYSFNGTAAGAITVGNASGSGGPSGTSFTFAVWVNMASGGTAQALLGSANNGPTLRWHGNYTFYFDKENVSGLVNATAWAYSVGVWHFVVATYDGTTATIYVNGKQDGQASPGTALSKVQTYLGACNNATSYIPAQSGTKMRMAGVWDRVLSAAEVATLSRNPWQLFATDMVAMDYEPANIIDPYATLSSPTATEVGETTARPRVTVTY